MEKLKPFIESILYESAIPIMLQTHKDVCLFSEDPTEYVRKQLDFTETLYMPKQIVIDLVVQICQYNSTREAIKKEIQGGAKKKMPRNIKPDYLVPFLNYMANNMTEYQQKTQQGIYVDWRIKEALLLAVGHLEDEI